MGDAEAHISVVTETRMGVPPPLASGLRIQELGDSLVVQFRPRRSWGALLFLTFWLLFWTAGGLAAAREVPKAPPSGAAFLLLWLCGWAAGECTAAFVIAWQLFGRTLLTVTPDGLEVRKQIGRFALTKRYDAALVRDITAIRVPADDGEGLRKDFCIGVSLGDTTVRIGEGLNEREAEYLASIVFSRVRPRSWWSEEEEARKSAPQSSATEESDRTRLGLIALVAVAIVVLGGTLLVARFGHRESPRAAPSEQPLRRLPPDRGRFSNPRDFAAAVTSYFLGSGPVKVMGNPSCGRHVTWTKWTCRVKAKETNGPFAGRVLSFRCATVDTIGGVTCSPSVDVLSATPPGPAPSR
jgi:hypothetical protein